MSKDELRQMASLPVYAIRKPLLLRAIQEIEGLEKQRDSLLLTINNALTSLAIIQMPTLQDVATNNELLKVMADSFREALK